MSSRARRGAWLAVVPLAPVVLVASACVQVLGIHDLPQDARVGRCGDGLTWASAACAECMDGRCCDEADACAASPACADEARCTAACAFDDAACRAACGAPFSPDTTRIGALEACRRRSCGAACLGCGAYGDALGAGCSTCLSTRCCDAERRVAERAVSDEAVTCILSCSDPNCRFECGASADRDAYDRFVDVVSCIKSCDACNVGSNWRCVDHYRRPPPLTTTAKYGVELVAFGQNRPLEGVAITACTDLACAKPVADTTSDATGFGQIVLPLDVTTGFDGFLLFHPKKQPSDPSRAILDSLLVVDHLTVDRIDRLELFSRLDYQIVKTAYPTADPARTAGVLFVAGDCDNAFAPGVRFVPNGPYAGLHVHYFQGMHTDFNTGAGFVVIEPDAQGELPASELAFDMLLDPEGTTVGSGVVPLRVGVISRIFAAPRSR